MSYYAQLKQQLKSLKLSGMIETLELRLLEAQQNQLSYSELLSSMLTDEIETRNMRKLQRLLSQAGIGSQGIFFIGPTGTGKTHLAQALCHQACRMHFSCAYYPFHQFFNELNKAELKNQLNQLIKKLIKIDLLVIDDFGFKKIDQQSAEFLYAIVDARYGIKSMILTSNRAITDWATIFPDPLMANAILDRLAHHSHQIILKGESYRKKFKPKLQNA